MPIRSEAYGKRNMTMRLFMLIQMLNRQNN